MNDAKLTKHPIIIELCKLCYRFLYIELKIAREKWHSKEKQSKSHALFGRKELAVLGQLKEAGQELSKWVATTKCGHVFVYLEMPCTFGHGATCLVQKQDQNSFGLVPHCGMFDGGSAKNGRRERWGC